VYRDFQWYKLNYFSFVLGLVCLPTSQILFLSAPKKQHIKKRIGTIISIFPRTPSLDAGVMYTGTNKHEPHNNLGNCIPSKLLTEHACCFPINENTFVIVFVQQDTHVQCEQFFAVSLWRNKQLIANCDYGKHDSECHILSSLTVKYVIFSFIFSFSFCGKANFPTLPLWVTVKHLYLCYRWNNFDKSFSSRD